MILTAAFIAGTVAGAGALALFTVAIFTVSALFFKDDDESLTKY
jgi:hypothetical protein